MSKREYTVYMLIAVLFSRFSVSAFTVYAGNVDGFDYLLNCLVPACNWEVKESNPRLSGVCHVQFKMRGFA